MCYQARQIVSQINQVVTQLQNAGNLFRRLSRQRNKRNKEDVNAILDLLRL